MSPTWSKVLHDWAHTLRSFANVLYFCVLIAVVSLTVLLAQYALPGPTCTVGSSSFPATMCLLGDSAQTPWGIVTAMFVHGSFEAHYLPNMLFLFSFAFIFISANASIPVGERRGRELVFVIGSFLVGVVANAVSLLVLPNSLTYGASGLVYAAWGITSAFCFSNAAPRGRLAEVRQYYSDRSNQWRAVYNATAFLLLTGIAFTAPALFLAAGPNVNVLAHGVSFILGFLGVGLYLICSALRRPSSMRIDH